VQAQVTAAAELGAARLRRQLLRPPCALAPCRTVPGCAAAGPPAGSRLRPGQTGLGRCWPRAARSLSPDLRTTGAVCWCVRGCARTRRRSTCPRLGSTEEVSKLHQAAQESMPSRQVAGQLVGRAGSSCRLTRSSGWVAGLGAHAHLLPPVPARQCRPPGPARLPARS
jgi:hypothetical protein